MNHGSLELPMELLEEAREMAQASQVSLEEWVVNAIAQKLEIDKTQRVFAQFAEKADFDRFDRMMARVPDVEPMPGDEIL